MQPRTDGKAAAARLLKLRRPEESWTDFAGRLKVSPQVISNYVQKRSGLALDTLGRIAPQLTDEELVYVVAGRKVDSPEGQSAAYANGLREAFGRMREALEREAATAAGTTSTDPGSAGRTKRTAAKAPPPPDGRPKRAREGG